MHSKALAWLFTLSLGVASAQTPPPVPAPVKPSLKELSPVKTEVPPPGVPVMVDVAKYRFYTVADYTGPVTWVVDGTSCGIKEVETPLTLFGLVQGQADPADYPIPTGALIVWGKSSGTTKVQALGVVNGKPTILLSLAFQTGPAPPTPVTPDVKPDPVKPDPVVPAPVASFRVIFVTESATTLTAQQNAVSGAKAVRDYLNAKVSKASNWPDYRNYDPQTTADNEYPAMKALWAAVKPSITTVPCMVVEVNGKADILPFPANAADALKTLQSYGGK